MWVSVYLQFVLMPKSSIIWEMNYFCNPSSVFVFNFLSKTVKIPCLWLIIVKYFTPFLFQYYYIFFQPRKVLLEQLCRVLPSEDWVPEQLILVNTGDPLGALLAAKLQDRNHKVICTASSADIRATVTCLVNKIQKL